MALDLRDGFCGELRAAAACGEARLAFRVRARRNEAVGGLGRVDQRLGGVDRWFLGLRTLAGGEPNSLGWVLTSTKVEPNSSSWVLEWTRDEPISSIWVLTLTKVEPISSIWVLPLTKVEPNSSIWVLPLTKVEPVLTSWVLEWTRDQPILTGNQPISTGDEPVVTRCEVKSSREAVLLLGYAGDFLKAARPAAGREPPATRRLGPAPGAGHDRGQERLPTAAERGREAFLDFAALNWRNLTLIACL